jgi:hypothetical protein
MYSGTGERVGSDQGLPIRREARRTTPCPDPTLSPVPEYVTYLTGYEDLHKNDSSHHESVTENSDLLPKLKSQRQGPVKLGLGWRETWPTSQLHKNSSVVWFVSKNIAGRRICISDQKSTKSSEPYNLWLNRGLHSSQYVTVWELVVLWCIIRRRRANIASL